MGATGSRKSGPAKHANERPKGSAKDHPTGTADGGQGGRPRRDDLTPLQRRGVAALLIQPSAAAAAAEIDVHPRTFTRWFREPAFAREYEAQVAELQQELWRRMLAVRDEVWDRFLELVRTEDERIALRSCTWFLSRMLSQSPLRRTQDDEEERLLSARLRALLHPTVAFDPADGGGTP